MNSKLTSRFAATVCAACAVTIAWAGSTGTVLRQLNAEYATLGKAFAHHDIKPLEGALSPHFTLVVQGKTVTRTAVVTDYQQQMMHMSNSSWVRKITALKLSGGTAIASVTGSFRGMFAGKDGKKHSFVLTSKSLDTWSKSGGKWMLLHSLVESLVPTIDGQRISRGG